MRVVVVAVLAVVGCGDGGPDYENTTPYPGPCSSRLEGPEVGTHEYTFDYDQATLIKLRDDWVLSDGDSGWDETSWQRNPDGTLASIRIRGSFLPETDRQVWTFDPLLVVVTFRGQPYSVYDHPDFAFHPSPGSSAIAPLADLGLIEHEGVTYTWTTEGDLRVRTGSDQRATYELDPMGRIVVLTRDLGNDGTVDVTLRFTFDGDRLARETSENAGNPWSVTWRYDLGGNVASSITESGGYGASVEEYDYSCW